MDESYIYMGYLFDACDSSDTPTTIGAATATIVGTLGGWGEGEIAQFAALPATAQLSGWIGGVASKANTAASAGNMTAFNALTDSDVDVPSGAGSGGGDGVLRLKEGVERFLITDINHPAGSAQAQNQIWTLWDILATVPEAFNHITGGANVLFMDGHVQYSKYIQDGPAPVNRVFAEFTSGLEGL